MRAIDRALILVAAVLAMAGCATAPVPAPTPEPDAAPAPAAEPAPNDFEAQRQQALRDSETPEAQAYEREFYPAIGQELANLLKKCTTEFPATADDSFEMVFRIDHWGEPKAVLVDPVTDLSSCVARGSWYFTYPHPGEKFSSTGLAVLVPISIE